jgi:hypothetical protein
MFPLFLKTVSLKLLDIESKQRTHSLFIRIVHTYILTFLQWPQEHQTPIPQFFVIYDDWQLG